jgi:hypothetical protein
LLGKKNFELWKEVLNSSVKRAAIVYDFNGIGKTVFASWLSLKMNEYFSGVGMKFTSTTRPEDIPNN